LHPVSDKALSLLFIILFIYFIYLLFIYLFICLFIYLFVYLFIYFSFFFLLQPVGYSDKAFLLKDVENSTLLHLSRVPGLDASKRLKFDEQFSEE
jgi:hypothetical protein